MLTVRYQELTHDGIPRFPVGITIRDYEWKIDRRKIININI
jgi:hypothetical protein